MGEVRPAVTYIGFSHTFTINDMNNHRPQVVWITGASAGIGAAMARAWARRGARLILSARSADALATVDRDCGGGHLILPLDITDSSVFDEAVATAWDWMGNVDIAVHNAGVSQRARAEQISEETLRRLMEVNFMGAAVLAGKQLARFQQQGYGHFVAISSLSGKFGVPYRSVYCASKHALHGYFDAIRAENASLPVRVTMVCPGYIRTDVSVNALGSDGKPTGEMDENQAKGMSPEACAEAIVSGVARNREEMVIGGTERFGVYLKRFFPRLLSRILAKRTGY